ncbi:unnamed protein product [Ostreobium quekettii]|uniref:Uncharacterized protein n=1 Tax=Ostreobium quekettii TaxID=121088 RepID=A0A8S1ISA8_9CHLO|nr:unnamed protein product [Ostreobium quekettii]
MVPVVCVCPSQANSTTLPDLRQDIVNNVKKVHSALECFANGEPPPMSPTLSLPDSLDGWLPPSTRHSSGATAAESLDSWLQDKSGSHKGESRSSMCSCARKHLFGPFGYNNQKAHQ